MKKFKIAFSNIGKWTSKAFSLVELMVTLIVVACITAALTPVITKKLKSKEVIVGGGGGNTNIEFAQDCSAFGSDCALCFGDKCSLCTKICEPNEYTNTPSCTCESCTNLGENCIACNSKKCTKCALGYGLNNLKQCVKCNEGQYSTGEIPCTICPENHICDGNSTSPTTCSDSEYAYEGSTTCTSCTNLLTNCAKCNPRECLECRKGYKLKIEGDEKYCILASGSATFGVSGSTKDAGDYTFTVPEAVDTLYVTMVSGGGGGAGGAYKTKTASFVISGNANITADSDNVVNTASDGMFKWIIPDAIKGKSVSVSSCGGGGQKGGGGNAGGGGAKNFTFTMPNWSQIEIKVGGWGGSGISGVGTGSDPIYNNAKSGGGTPNGSRINGGSGTSSSCQVGVWGGTDYNYTTTNWTAAGGKGGSATLFYHSEYANTANWVASGGAGGKGTTGGCSSNSAGKGGGGGGVDAGNANGGNGTGYGNTSGVFGSSYCGAQQNGAMRITYNDASNGGGGGGAGQIVPKTAISVNEGDVLTITVGAGGSGGGVNSAGGAGGISKITRNGEILLITSGGAGGGAANGSGGTGGYVTNGLTTNNITVDGYSSENGGSNSSTTGGNGGRTTIEGRQTHCSPGVGGIVNTAASTIDDNYYGGCGGGGGGGNAVGSSGARGYVKISWGEE